ncbi:alpha/beta fold hydrolase [Bifidobacterium xylocopae]|uniref:Lysophospholipase n=1 Tax=Bifidobacterium xylocopae TaxID=2493119 RepID=A0A366KD35_9BIFI|nr:alpha/beta fold hydrolase [Bifidobacterium xylocopae]RBP99614.1 lysophospholipase [Bifidobacterium xylocopae]
MELELIDEGRFERTMRDMVLPALEHCKREGWMRSHAPGGVSEGMGHGAASAGLEPSASVAPTASGFGAAVSPSDPNRLHYVCYEASAFDDLNLPGSQGRHRGVVIISHGFTEFAGKYDELAWYFLLAGYTVCIVEHWGHGLSGRGVDDPSLVWVDSYRRYVEDLATFCEEMATDYGGDQPICLYAHSMGGGIAASLLERHPTLIDRVVLSSPMIAPRTGLALGLAGALMHVACATGQGRRMVPGHHRFNPVFDPAFVGNASQARLRWIHGLRAADPAYQTSAASYRWVGQAIALSRELLRPALCERVEASALVFQAEPDTFVLPRPQNRFVDQVRTGGGAMSLVRVPQACHELYTMPNGTLGPYLARILDFFAAPTPLVGGGE